MSDSSPQSTSAEELRKKGFEIGKVIGEGTYSKVRSTTYEGQEIAVKVIKLANKSDIFFEKFLPRELKVIGKLQHQNIIKVFKIFQYPDKVYIFMEYARGGSLLKFMQDHGALSECQARKFSQQLVSGLRYLHNLNIAHRDLKCENIMLTDKCAIKIIDFGFCKTVVDADGKRILSETFCGSIAYAAPEVLRGKPYNPMMYDVWSLGIVLFMMLAAAPPFNDKSVQKMVKCQLERKIVFPSTLNSKVKELIKRMLEPDITKRITMIHVEQNIWLKKDEAENNGR